MVDFPVFLVFLIATVSAASLDVKNTKYMVHISERKGHRFALEVDVKNGQRYYSGIAVAKFDEDLLFTEYDKSQFDKECVTFNHFGQGVVLRCSTDGPIFLLQEDFMKFKRMTYKAYKKNNEQCEDGQPAIGEGQSLLMFEKSNVVDTNSPKRIGTYYKVNDAFYWAFGDDHRNKEDLATILRLDGRGLEHPDRFEVFCRVPHSYPKNQ